MTEPNVGVKAAPKASALNDLLGGLWPWPWRRLSFCFAAQAEPEEIISLLEIKTALFAAANAITL
jgi:hypothetical protein